MPAKNQPRLEFSINWFDKWNIDWSCNEDTWKQVSEKFKSPMIKFIAIGTGLAIGASGTVYCLQKIDQALHPSPQSIEAPVPKE
jgi:hypothetical protein